MEEDKLTQIWNSQDSDLTIPQPNNIIKRAKEQRNGQFTAITIMSITALIIIVYTAYFASFTWNNFTIGLALMISSLTFRVILEFISLYRRESQLISLNNTSFQQYLKSHYKKRLLINFIITPICFVLYIYGFTKLLPYFEVEFSSGFYTYILISGFGSILLVGLIIIRSIRKENRFLTELNEN